MENLDILKKFISTHMPSLIWEYSGYVKNEFYDAQTDWNQTLITKINQLSASVCKDTKRGGANVVMISENMVDIFKTLEYMRGTEVQHEGYYKLGELAGRYIVYVVPKLTERTMNFPNQNNELEAYEFDEVRVYVCHLKDTNKIFDTENYSKIGIIEIKKFE